MRFILLTALLFILNLDGAEAQYEIYIKSLIKVPKAVPNALSGQFLRKNSNIGSRYYEFTNSSFPVCYYQPDGDCGYFKLFGKEYTIKGKYEVWEEFGCDLDIETFKAFQLKLNNRNYFLLTSIAVSNGRGTRDVFCQLFDITDKSNVVHYPLWSVYGSSLSFGDYNGDGKVDFLEVRNENDEKNDNIFKMQFKTIDSKNLNFKNIKGKYIIFKREFSKNMAKTTIVKNHW